MIRVIHILEDIVRPGQVSDMTWVEAGTYKILRDFDSKRLLIDMNAFKPFAWRSLTLVDRSAGKISQIKEEKL